MIFFVVKCLALYIDCDYNLGKMLRGFSNVVFSDSVLWKI